MKIRVQSRNNGPTCGRRYLVNALFDSADRFYRYLLRTETTWIGDPKWHGRFRALKRSRRNHGENAAMIDLLHRVVQEWEERRLSSSAVDQPEIRLYRK